jgi:hypothetical protein
VRSDRPPDSQRSSGYAMPWERVHKIILRPAIHGLTAAEDRGWPPFEADLDADKRQTDGYSGVDGRFSELR